MFSKLDFDAKNKKRVSFILATKNRAQFLDKALKEFQRLVDKNKDELIIVDGGSSDLTFKVISKYSSLVNIFVSEPDLSESHALNKAVLLSQGKYIKTLTDDDIYYKNAIEEAVKVMEKNSEIDVLLCGGTKSRGNKKWLAYAPPGSNYGENVSDVFKYGGCGIGMFIRRSAFAKTDLFTAGVLALDLDYLTKAIANGAIVKFCRINMFHHPLEDHSASVNRREKLLKERVVLMKQYGLSSTVYLQQLRIITASVIFPFLPGFVKSPYKKYMAKTQKNSLVEPVWDGGIS